MTIQRVVVGVQLAYVVGAAITFTTLGGIFLFFAIDEIGGYYCGHVCPTPGEHKTFVAFLLGLGFLGAAAGASAALGWIKAEWRNRMTLVSFGLAVSAVGLVHFLLAWEADVHWGVG